jgi:hypothetical protein
MRWLAFLALTFVSVQAFAVNLTQSFKSGETSRYKVVVKMTGKALVPGELAPIAINSSFELTVRLKYLKDRAKSDFPSRITLEAENAISVFGDSRLSVGKEVFPDLTFILDSSGDITRVVPPDDVPYRLPGINYRNMVLLLHTYAPAGELKPGDSWKKTAKIVGSGEPLEFKYKLDAIEDKPGGKLAKIKADVLVLLPSDSNCNAVGTAICNFSLAPVRLESAHVEMNVRWTQDKAKSGGGDTDKQEEPPSVAVKFDISKIN